MLRAATWCEFSEGKLMLLERLRRGEYTITAREALGWPWAYPGASLLVGIRDEGTGGHRDAWKDAGGAEIHVLIRAYAVDWLFKLDKSKTPASHRLKITRRASRRPAVWDGV